MENKKGLIFGLVVVVLILGSTLLKHFNFKTLSFKSPALVLVYLITFLISIYLIIKNYKKSPEK